jgi:3-phenylpropionate/trans-cinnamate dioxygenase ferredoxin subunit
MAVFRNIESMNNTERDKFCWFKIGETDEKLVGEKELRVMTAGPREICITSWEGRIYAFSGKCPHAGGCLGEGYMDGRGNVVCPVHGYRYKVKNGYNSSGEGFYLRTFIVESRQDGIYVGLPESSLGGLMGR